MGARDIRTDYTGAIDFRVTRLLRSYRREDPAPHRVKPVPLQVITHLLHLAYNSTTGTDTAHAVADIACIGFFFLMRPGEYTVTTENEPFRQQDVKLFLGASPLSLATATHAHLHAATSVSYTFTTQKNAVKGEVITNGRTGDLLTCPVRATIRRLSYHKQQRLPATAPLGTYIENNKQHTVSNTQIKTALRTALAHLGPSKFNIQPADIDARSLRAGGATALLTANIDINTIQLIGRWKSDAMLRYLHISANPNVHRHARTVFEQGQITFHPDLYVPTNTPPSLG